MLRQPHCQLSIVNCQFTPLKGESEGSLLESVRIVLLPVPGVAAHILDAVFSLPAQFALGLGGIAVAGGNVARTAGLDAVGHVDAVDLDEGLHHVEHGIAVTGADIVDGDALLALNALKSSHMSLGQIDHVDVVAHAGAVGGGVVVAEDAQLLTLAHSHLGEG